jgi:sugar phosphate isomerase/epimerase
MRIAISNIAWDINEDGAMARLLTQYLINAIDIAPGKYFPEPAEATARQVDQVRAWWADQGIELTGMQALLFGTQGLNLFGSTAVQQRMLDHLAAICRIGGRLGATRLVFGSPKNRDRSSLTDAETLTMAVSFFRQLGDIAASEGVQVCLEPNPTCYGANFMTSSLETAQVVQAVDHPAIRMQFDSGALTLNGEDPFQVLCESSQLIGHVHLSEPNLLPLGDGSTNHQTMAQALQQYLPNALVSIEMVATKEEPHGLSIERALATANQFYSQPERLTPA